MDGARRLVGSDDHGVHSSTRTSLASFALTMFSDPENLAGPAVHEALVVVEVCGDKVARRVLWGRKGGEDVGAGREAKRQPVAHEGGTREEGGDVGCRSAAWHVELWRAPGAESAHCELCPAHGDPCCERACEWEEGVHGGGEGEGGEETGECAKEDEAGEEDGGVSEGWWDPAGWRGVKALVTFPACCRGDG